MDCDSQPLYGFLLVVVLWAVVLCWLLACVYSVPLVEVREFSFLLLLSFLFSALWFTFLFWLSSLLFVRLFLTGLLALSAAGPGLSLSLYYISYPYLLDIVVLRNNKGFKMFKVINPLLLVVCSYVKRKIQK